MFTQPAGHSVPQPGDAIEKALDRVPADFRHHGGRGVYAQGIFYTVHKRVNDVFFGPGGRIAQHFANAVEKSFNAAFANVAKILV